MWCDSAFFNEAQWHSGLHQIDRAVWKIIRQLRTVISHLSPSGYFVYLHIYCLRILHSAHIVYLRVSVGPQNKWNVFPYTAIVGRSLHNIPRANIAVNQNLHISQCSLISKQAVPRLRQFVVDVWSRKPTFDSRLVDLGIVMGKVVVTLGFF